MNKKLFSMLSTLLLAFYCNQVSALSFSWVKQIGGIQTTAIIDGTADNTGNLLYTGLYQGKTDFDTGIDTFYLSPQNSNDAFVCKLDFSGNLKWAKTFGGNGSDRANNIAVDSAGNVYVLGTFSLTTDLNPDTGLYTVTSVGENDIFILKLDSSGNFLWAKTIGGINDEYVGDCKIDRQGNIVITGFFSDTLDFDPNAGVVNSSSTVKSVFMLKLDGTGNFIWVETFVSTVNSFGNAISIDKNNNYLLAGSFQGTIDLDPGPGLNTFTAPIAEQMMFILKLNAGGNLVWAKTMGGGAQSSPSSMELDYQGNILLTGVFSNICDVYPGVGIYYLYPHGAIDIFVEKLDTSGNLIWAKLMGGNWSDYVYCLTTDKMGRIYLTGYFMDQCNFDQNHPNIYYTSNGFYDIFICGLDPMGNTLWTTTFGGSSSEEGVSVIADTSGNLIASGYFDLTIDFDPGIGVSNLTSVSGLDAYILKLQNVTLGITKNKIQTSLVSWPNPVDRVVNIYNTDGVDTDYQVIDILGKQVMKGNLKGSTTQVDLSGLEKGMYLLRSNSATIKLIKN